MRVYALCASIATNILPAQLSTTQLWDRNHLMLCWIFYRRIACIRSASVHGGSNIDGTANLMVVQVFFLQCFQHEAYLQRLLIVWISMNAIFFFFFLPRSFLKRRSLRVRRCNFRICKFRVLRATCVPECLNVFNFAGGLTCILRFTTVERKNTLAWTCPRSHGQLQWTPSRHPPSQPGPAPVPSWPLRHPCLHHHSLF